MGTTVIKYGQVSIEDQIINEQFKFDENGNMLDKYVNYREEEQIKNSKFDEFNEFRRKVILDYREEYSSFKCESFDKLMTKMLPYINDYHITIMNFDDSRLLKINDMFAVYTKLNRWFNENIEYVNSNLKYTNKEIDTIIMLLLFDISGITADNVKWLFEYKFKNYNHDMDCYEICNIKNPKLFDSIKDTGETLYHFINMNIDLFELIKFIHIHEHGHMNYHPTYEHSVILNKPVSHYGYYTDIIDKLKLMIFFDESEFDPINNNQHKTFMKYAFVCLGNTLTHLRDYSLINQQLEELIIENYLTKTTDN